jgi:putative ATPase
MTGHEDLFAVVREDAKRSAAPLPARMRPRTLDEVVGQAHLLTPGAAFRSLVEGGRLGSIILWGPPGSGKTSAGVKDVREVLARADARLGEGRGPTILFLDEIHRFTKAQQDALLPGVEDGTISLIGATTENPFFEVNSPLISRATVFRTEALEHRDIEALIDMACSDPMRGLNGAVIEPEARTALAERVGGDARLALNSLDIASTIARGRGDLSISLAVVEEALQRRVVRYDRTGDRHYDVISAFIKSMRGSDADATMYWLQTMVAAGEDPKFIARRMVVFASEDVGLADSAALPLAISAFRAVEVVGLPEANYAIAHAAVYLALAPKSNTVARAIGAASDSVEHDVGGEVPPHLRSGATSGERAMGIGVGYRYPHDDPIGVVQQQYLPDSVVDAVFVHPQAVGAEREIRERLGKIDAILGKRRNAQEPPN